MDKQQNTLSEQRASKRAHEVSLQRCRYLTILEIVAGVSLLTAIVLYIVLI